MRGKGWRGRGSLRPASERRTKKNSPKKRKGPSTRRRGGGGSRPEREKRRFEEPCEDVIPSLSVGGTAAAPSVEFPDGGAAKGEVESAERRGRGEREREKKRSTITKKKMSNFRGLVASQKTEGKEPFRDRKEPVLSLPAAANSRPLSGRNPLLVSTFVDLFPPRTRQNLRKSSAGFLALRGNLTLLLFFLLLDTEKIECKGGRLSKSRLSRASAASSSPQKLQQRGGRCSKRINSTSTRCSTVQRTLR